MTAKKNILFVMNNLHVGGAEKALVSMLQVFDYDRYDIDLLLFKKEGLFLKQVPEQVNFLEPPANYQYFDMPFSNVIRKNIFKNPLVIFRRWQFNQARKKATSPAEAEQFGWKPLSETLEALPHKYDAAIGFLEKTPNYFVVDKVEAKIKIGFVHNDYQALALNSGYDEGYFKKLAHIISVSQNCVDILKKVFPQYAAKCSLIENISSREMIMKLAAEKVDFHPVQLSILSVGRLSEQKNFQMAIAAAELLVKKGAEFEWNILGEGSERGLLEKLIQEKAMESSFKLLGIKENPYPYIAKSLIYVQPSKFEGKSVAIDEAKILGKPIVVTNFPTAKDQIVHHVTGLIADLTPESLADQIYGLLQDTDFQKQLSYNLSREKVSTEDEIEKLYQLIES